MNPSLNHSKLTNPTRSKNLSLIGEISTLKLSLVSLTPNPKVFSLEKKTYLVLLTALFLLLNPLFPITISKSQNFIHQPFHVEKSTVLFQAHILIENSSRSTRPLLLLYCFKIFTNPVLIILKRPKDPKLHGSGIITKKKHKKWNNSKFTLSCSPRSRHFVKNNCSRKELSLSGVGGKRLR